VGAKAHIWLPAPTSYDFNSYYHSLKIIMKKILKKIVISILTLEARLVLKKYKPHIIAVTGNVGKTSTKDAIYTVISKVHYVRKSEKSFNSEIGIPLTILGGRNGWNNAFIWFQNILEGLALIFLKNHYPKCLVLELGADRPGLMKQITSWLKPDVVIVTKIGVVPVHVEIFKTTEKLIQEKAFLVESLKNNGILIMYADDENSMSLKEKFSGRVITFGFNEGSTIRASNENILYNNKGKPLGINFKVNYGSISVPVQLKGSLGYHHAYSVLAALSVAVSQDINLISAVQWMGEYQIPQGRLRNIDGKENFIILDDSYNASPSAMVVALETLLEVNTTGRKIAILGDMMELGKYSTDAHKNIGRIVSGIADILITVGTRSKMIAEEAHLKKMPKKNIISFNSSEEAGKYARGIIKENDIVLVKGSQSVRMERIVKELMAHPENAHKLLVRQDAEWLAKE